LSDYPDEKFCSQKFNQTILGSQRKINWFVRAQYDVAPGQTSWRIVDTVANKNIVNMKRGSVKKKKAKITRKVNLVPYRVYKLEMKDSQRNGFTRGIHGKITIQGYHEGTLVYEREFSGKFNGYSSVNEFAVPPM